jgi:mRNA-degrading endonuclease RelE of RelBE toxin-antitoxin system
MNWAVRLSRDAVKDLSRIPADRRELLLKQLSAMEVSAITLRSEKTYR